MHSKSCERRKFKVTKFPNRTTKLIHQMWDEVVIVIIIEKENKMVITFEAVQIDVEGSSMIKAPKKKGGDNKGKKGRRRLTTSS